MAKKYTLLLLDANVVVELFRLAIWDKVVAYCEIHLALTVVEEAHFYTDADGERHSIELEPYISARSVKVFDPTLKEAEAFLSKFDKTYSEKLDPGELASLIYLRQQPSNCLICSADAIVYRVLGNLRIQEQGISLEELLRGGGLTCVLDSKFTASFRDKWTKKGFAENLWGTGAN